MTDLRLYVCGRLAVEASGAVVLERAFPARQGRRLWVYLVLHRRWPVARADLVDAVWGIDAPDAADAALNVLVSRLRAALRPVTERDLGLAIRGDVGRYAVALPPNAFVDIERARAAAHAADTLARGGDLAAALAEARVAMEIANRGLLPGEDGAWIEGAREALAAVRARAHERTVELELARGGPDRAESEARDLLAIDPLRESGYRLLMRALAAGGNPGAVPGVLAQCRHVLATRAGLTPSPETERAARDLVAP